MLKKKKKTTTLDYLIASISSVQSLSRVQVFVTPWTAARQASLSTINSQSLLKLTSIESVMPSNHHRVGDAIQPSHPVSSPSPPAFNLSQHQGLFQRSVLCIRWPKYWNFSILEYTLQIYCLNIV